MQTKVTYLFADDTLLYVTGVNFAQVVQSENYSLINIRQYLRNNKLKLNASKIKAMIITATYKHTLNDLDTIIIEIYMVLRLNQ